jgi:drug/metabolite transporter (DMT)-like permease
LNSPADNAIPTGPAGPTHKPWIPDFIALAAIWGGSFLLMHISVFEFGPVPTSAMRLAIATVFLLPMVWFRGQMSELLRHWPKMIVVGLLNSGIPFACFAFALLSLTTGLSAIMNATVPMFGALVAWIWLRDKPDASRILGLVLGFAGVAMLAWDKATFKPQVAGGLAPGWAVLACLLACICYALAASYTKRYLMGVPSLVTAAGSQVGGLMGLALPAVWLWPSQTPSATAWLAVLGVGVVCTGMAYILFFRLIGNVGPPRALAVTFVVPVFALFYGAVLLGEIVTPWMILSGAVIVCGTALSTGLLRLGRRKSP